MTVRGKAAPDGSPPASDEGSHRDPAPAYRSEGQRLFCALTTSPSMIARELGVVKGAVSNWRAGTFIPNDKQRRRVAEVYGVPESAWERIPTGALPPVDVDEPAPTAPHESNLGSTSPGDEGGPEPSVMDDCLKQLAWLRRQLAREDILARERIALNDAFRKALKDKARYQLDAENSENRMVRTHPAWQRFKRALLVVLQRHPAAARDVTELITELLGEEDRP